MRDIWQGMVKEENERERAKGSQLSQKIIEAKGEARGTTFTGLRRVRRLDHGIPRDLSVSGTIVLYVDLLAPRPGRRARVASQSVKCSVANESLGLSVITVTKIS